MTDILYIVDDADIVHWKIYDPADEYSVNEFQDWASSMRHHDWPVHTLLQDVDEEALKDLSIYLFDTYHGTDGDLTEYLLDRFDYDVNAFVDFLAVNFKRDSLRNIRDKLTRALER